MNHNEVDSKEESTISITGHGQISWELDLKIVCYKGQKPIVIVGDYKDYSTSKPDVVDNAREQIKESRLTDFVIERTTSTYVGYKHFKKSGYLLMIAPRQQGRALSISIPSKWDKKSPQILRLTYVVKLSKYAANAVAHEEKAIVWVFPNYHAKEEFQAINKQYNTQLPEEQVSGTYQLPEIVSNEEQDWKPFVRALESSSCCVVGRDEPKFPKLENYTIPKNFVPEFLDLCLPQLIDRARQ
ncbi:hypothetical protein NG799_25705 [Laspinema sp. D1]|uniref:Uncharacterized protein n=1 Tax=Laspinema palackyanum D2a TaxID=2953684 RepID=A0ABT2N249_9CYAN|nr:hypothetical protein [Laspinema sp. D2a]